MSRMTMRSSAGVFAAAARGRNSSRTASQFRPFIVLSKWVFLMIVQAASNVSAACGGWAAPTADDADDGDRGGDRAKPHHLMSALI